MALIKKRHMLFFAVILAASLLIFDSCNKGEEEYPLNGPNLSMDDIAGNWKATHANFNSDTLFFDVIAEGGTVTLSIQSNGRFTFTITLPDEPNDVSTGQLGFDEQWLAIGFDEDPGEYVYYFIELDKGILTLRGEAEFDYGDGGERPGSVDLVMERI